MQTKGVTETLTALVHCSADELGEKVSSLVKLVAEQNGIAPVYGTINSLKEKLNTRMLQMNELSTRMKH